MLLIAEGSVSTAAAVPPAAPAVVLPSLKLPADGGIAPSVTV
jgi:hypothetical protein